MIERCIDLQYMITFAMKPITVLSIRPYNIAYPEIRRQEEITPIPIILFSRVILANVLTSPNDLILFLTSDSHIKKTPFINSSGSISAASNHLKPKHKEISSFEKIASIDINGMMVYNIHLNNEFDSLIKETLSSLILVRIGNATVFIAETIEFEEPTSIFFAWE